MHPRVARASQARAPQAKRGATTHARVMLATQLTALSGRAAAPQRPAARAARPAPQRPGALSVRAAAVTAKESKGAASEWASLSQVCAGAFEGSAQSPCNILFTRRLTIPTARRAVLGSQWGDEGKGKLVDILAQQYDIVARCQVRSPQRSSALRPRRSVPLRLRERQLHIEYPRIGSTPLRSLARALGGSPALRASHSASASVGPEKSSVNPRGSVSFSCREGAFCLRCAALPAADCGDAARTRGGYLLQHNGVPHTV